MTTDNTQDKELREAILLEFKNVHRLAPADYTENCTNIVMQLITADRKRVELEARLDEAKLVAQLFVGLPTKTMKRADLKYYLINRIAELKSQQEVK